MENYDDSCAEHLLALAAGCGLPVLLVGLGIAALVRAVFS